MQRDPMGIAANINLYTYVHNNPTIFIDPYGLFDYKEAFIQGGKDAIAVGTLGALLGASTLPTPYTATGGALIGAGLGFAGGFIKGGLSDSEVPGSKIGAHALSGALEGTIGGLPGALTGAGIGIISGLIPDSDSGSGAVNVTDAAGREAILGCIGGIDSGVTGCIIGAGSGIITGAFNEGLDQCTE